MNKLNLVHWWNARICPIIGLIFNFLLIFLVINKTPKEMRIHSRILLQTGVFDILILSLTIFGQPASSSHSNVVIYLFDGYLSFMFKNDSILIYIFSHTINLFLLCDILGVASQFIYRYLVLNRNIKINLSKYLGMLSLILLPLCIYLVRNGMLNAIEGKRMPFNESGILYTDELMREYFVDENCTVKYFVHNTKNIGLGTDTNLFIVGFIVYSLISYLTIAFCGWKISRFVNANLTGRKKDLSKQLNRNLILLAILPIFYIICLTITVSLPTINGVRNEKEEWITIKIRQLYTTLTLHWMPVLNPLISIITNTPYRNAIIKMVNRRIVPASN